jgi:hypothetical protein
VGGTLDALRQGDEGIEDHQRKTKHVFTGGWNDKGCTSVNSTHEGKFEKLASFSEAEEQQLKALLKYVKVQASGVAGKPTVQFSGANVQVVNGEGKTASKNGTGNLVIGYDENKEGKHEQTGSHDLILGEEQTFTSYGGILAGSLNTISAPFAAVSGGKEGTASGEWASISSGKENKASGNYASVSGGLTNTASGEWASASGGFKSFATNRVASISGGSENKAAGEFAAVSGGSKNTASGAEASVSGGFINTASGEDASVSGGDANTATNSESWVGGGLGTTPKRGFQLSSAEPKSL